MSGPGDAYRLRAADLFAMAEQQEHFQDDFTELARAYLRLAELADRNAQVDQSGGIQQQQQQRQQHEPPQQQPTQQQQQPQPSDKPAD